MPTIEADQGPVAQGIEGEDHEVIADIDVILKVVDDGGRGKLNPGADRHDMGLQG